METQHPKNPVNIEYVNHGDVFNKGYDWFTFYCGNCKQQISGTDEKCDKCGAILQHKQK